MKKHKLLLVAVSVFVLAGIFITAFAINGGKKPESTSGKWENLIADRIELTLENTEFTLKRSGDAAEEYTLTMLLTAKKTQGDFWGVINSFELSGIAYDNIVFTALSEAAQNKTIDSLVLTSTNGTPDTYKWQTDINVSIQGKGTYTPVIRLHLTSGMTKDTASERIVEIPLKITVE